MVSINLSKEFGCSHEGFDWEKNRDDVDNRRQWSYGSSFSIEGDSK